MGIQSVPVKKYILTHFLKHSSTAVHSLSSNIHGILTTNFVSDEIVFAQSLKKFARVVKLSVKPPEVEKGVLYDVIRLQIDKPVFVSGSKSVSCFAEDLVRSEIISKNDIYDFLVRITEESPYGRILKPNVVKELKRQEDLYRNMTTWEVLTEIAESSPRNSSRITELVNMSSPEIIGGRGSYSTSPKPSRPCKNSADSLVSKDDESEVSSDHSGRCTPQKNNYDSHASGTERPFKYQSENGPKNTNTKAAQKSHNSELSPPGRCENVNLNDYSTEEDEPEIKAMINHQSDKCEFQGVKHTQNGDTTACNDPDGLTNAFRSGKDGSDSRKNTQAAIHLRKRSNTSLSRHPSQKDSRMEIKVPENGYNSAKRPYHGPKNGQNESRGVSRDDRDYNYDLSERHHGGAQTGYDEPKKDRGEDRDRIYDASKPQNSAARTGYDRMINRSGSRCDSNRNVLKIPYAESKADYDESNVDFADERDLNQGPWKHPYTKSKMGYDTSKRDFADERNPNQGARKHPFAGSKTGYDKTRIDFADERDETNSYHKLQTGGIKSMHIGTNSESRTGERTSHAIHPKNENIGRFYAADSPNDRDHCNNPVIRDRSYGVEGKMDPVENPKRAYEREFDSHIHLDSNHPQRTRSVHRNSFESTDEYPVKRRNNLNEGRISPQLNYRGPESLHQNIKSSYREPTLDERRSDRKINDLPPPKIDSKEFIIKCAKKDLKDSKTLHPRVFRNLSTEEQSSFLLKHGIDIEKKDFMANDVLEKKILDISKNSEKLEDFIKELRTCKRAKDHEKNHYDVFKKEQTKFLRKLEPNNARGSIGYFDKQRSDKETTSGYEPHNKNRRSSIPAEESNIRGVHSGVARNPPKDGYKKHPSGFLDSDLLTQHDLIRKFEKDDPNRTNPRKFIPERFKDFIFLGAKSPVTDREKTFAAFLDAKPSKEYLLNKKTNNSSCETEAEKTITFHKMGSRFDTKKGGKLSRYDDWNRTNFANDDGYLHKHLDPTFNDKNQIITAKRCHSTNYGDTLTFSNKKMKETSADLAPKPEKSPPKLSENADRNSIPVVETTLSPDATKNLSSLHPTSLIHIGTLVEMGGIDNDDIIDAFHVFSFLCFSNKLLEVERFDFAQFCDEISDIQGQSNFVDSIIVKIIKLVLDDMNSSGFQQIKDYFANCLDNQKIQEFLYRKKLPGANMDKLAEIHAVLGSDMANAGSELVSATDILKDYVDQECGKLEQAQKGGEVFNDPRISGNQQETGQNNVSTCVTAQLVQKSAKVSNNSVFSGNPRVADGNEHLVGSISKQVQKSGETLSDSKLSAHPQETDLNTDIKRLTSECMIGIASNHSGLSTHIKSTDMKYELTRQPKVGVLQEGNPIIDTAHPQNTTGLNSSVSISKLCKILLQRNCRSIDQDSTIFKFEVNINTLLNESVHSNASISFITRFFNMIEDPLGLYTKMDVAKAFGCECYDKIVRDRILIFHFFTHYLIQTKKFRVFLDSKLDSIKQNEKRRTGLNKQLTRKNVELRNEVDPTRIEEIRQEKQKLEDEILDWDIWLLENRIRADFGRIDDVQTFVFEKDVFMISKNTLYYIDPYMYDSGIRRARLNNVKDSQNFCGAIKILQTIIKKGK